MYEFKIFHNINSKIIFSEEQKIIPCLGNYNYFLGNPAISLFFSFSIAFCLVLQKTSRRLGSLRAQSPSLPVRDITRSVTGRWALRFLFASRPHLPVPDAQNPNELSAVTSRFLFSCGAHINRRWRSTGLSTKYRACC